MSHKRVFSGSLDKMKHGSPNQSRIHDLDRDKFHYDKVSHLIVDQSQKERIWKAIGRLFQYFIIQEQETSDSKRRIYPEEAEILENADF